MANPLQNVQLSARNIVSYSSVSLSTSATQESQVIVPVVKGLDIIGFDLQLSVTATGTLSSAKNVLYAIQRLAIVDKSGSPVMDVAGSDLNKLVYWLSPRGTYQTPATSTQNTAETFESRLNLPIKYADQVAYVQVTFAPYSALATSGCTGATVSLGMGAYYGMAQKTMRIYKSANSVSSGVNHLGFNLQDGVTAVIMGWTVGTESYVTDVIFSRFGDIDDYSAIVPQTFINIDTETVSGHETGMFNLYVSPFVISKSNTKLDFNMSSSDTVTVYTIGYY